MKPKKDAPVPPDMAEVFQLMDDAKQQVLFLAFYPGFPSVISKVGEMNQTRNDLFIRGAVSSPQALPRDATQLFHGSTAQPVVVTAAALDDDFAAWHKELLKAGPDAHAIIHDKIIVIDPLSEKDCVVILGSHNLGFKASYQNDENMLIIRGNRALAIAYMVHVLDVYDHYRFRYLRATRKSKFSGFLSTNDKWQGKYLNGPARKELEYMTGASGLTKVA
jgi:phosphatidylserine/phosphatidylglycerophosphate/cardiolipin synthase-like enzyme